MSVFVVKENMDLTVEQLTHKLTLRVLGKLARNGAHPVYELLYSNAYYSLGEILREEGLNKTVWAIRRGKRLYLLHPATRRIICELGIIAEPVAEFKFITLRGIIPATETVASLVEATAKRGLRHNPNNTRKEGYEQHH